MPNPEILSLLCAGTVKYEYAAVGGRGQAVLTRAEISALMAGLPPEAMDLALAKYTQAEECERRLIATLQVWAVGLAVDERWETVRGRPTVCNMCVAAVYEVVKPNVCACCRGSGRVREQRHARLCLVCNGTGHKALAQRSIAEVCGIPETTWRRTWAGRYERVYRRVNAWDGQVAGALKRQGAAVDA
jgi:hypothetical protein